jgi:translocation and assembly module TamB
MAAPRQPEAQEAAEAQEVAPKRKRRKLALWARITLGITVAIAALMATGVGLRYWITSDGGRAFVVSQIDGRRVGPLGTLRVEGLEGDPLEAATFADIALVDDDGVWLRARDTRIEWTPSRLFSGELEIAAIQIGTVDVLRAPRTTYQSQNNPPPDIGLKLDSVIIDELNIAETLFRPVAKYKIVAAAARPREGSGFARLDLAPLTGPGDKLTAKAEWTVEGSLKGEASATGPIGGLIATILQAPETADVTFAASLDGTVQKFAGEARLGFSSRSVAAIDMSRDGSIAKLDATLNADLWPALEPIARRTGGSVTLKGEAKLEDFANAPVSLQLDAPAGQVILTTVADLENNTLRTPLNLSTRGLDLSFIAPPVTGKVDAEGTMRLIGLSSFEWKGQATVTDATWPSGGAREISGPVTIAKDRSTIYWEAPAALVRNGYVSSLKGLAPANYAAATRGEVNLSTRIVEVTAAQVRGAPGEASGRGTYTIATGGFSYSGAASFARLADLAPLTGSARGQWEVTRADRNAPIRIRADATGRDVSSRIRALADLAGASPSVRMTGVVRGGRFTIESGRVEGTGVSATMTGRVSDTGAISARASGNLKRPLHLPATTINTAAIAADITGQMSAPRMVLRLSDGSVTVAGMSADRIVGEAQATLGKTIAGNFAMSGGTQGQPLTARGRLTGGDGVWRIANLNATLGGLQVNAPELAFANGGVTAAFDASGSLAGYAGLDRGTLTARGTIATKGELELAVSGQLANLREGEVRLDLITFDATASEGQARVSGKLKGRVGAPLDLSFGASGSHEADGWIGAATLEGTVDQLPIKTSRPAQWRFGENSWLVDAELAAFGGRFAANVSTDQGVAKANLDLMDVDVRALSRLARITPIEGRISGEIDYLNGPQPATGDLKLEVSNVNPLGVKADPISLDITSQLRNGRMITNANGSGQGFKMEASGDIGVRAGAGFDVAPEWDAPANGHLTLDGRADQLWALFGPEEQSFRGRISANVDVAGLLRTPKLTGGFEIAEAAYEHGETGLRLRNLAAKGQFSESSARITDVSADDGQGGRITGEGDINWEKDIDGNVQFTAVNLRALNREDRSAVVSGQGAVRLDPEAISVTGEFDVAQARISIEQSAATTIPRLPIIRRTNFPNQEEEGQLVSTSPFRRPVQLDLKVKAPRRVVVFGRGLDTEWAVDFRVHGTIANPEIQGTATLVRGDLDLAGRRFAFDTGSINLDGPIKTARIDISAERTAADIDAKVHVTGTPVEPKFSLESTPSLPQDEILARVLFGRSMAELSAFEAAQLAAGLTQLAGGQAGFDPVGLVRKATGLDRVSVGASGGVATVSAGKYIANDVYLQVGAGGEGGVGAEVEWEPRENLSVISSAQGNGDTKLAVRWKRDY